MSKLKWLLAAILLSTVSAAQANSCKQNNLGLEFRQVVLGLEGALRCDYGPEFDFKHSYDLGGKFKPGQGPWMGSSDPSVVYCQASVADQCSFY